MRLACSLTLMALGSAVPGCTIIHPAFWVEKCSLPSVKPELAQICVVHVVKTDPFTGAVALSNGVAVSPTRALITAHTSADWRIEIDGLPAATVARSAAADDWDDWQEVKVPGAAFKPAVLAPDARLAPWQPVFLVGFSPERFRTTHAIHDFMEADTVVIVGAQVWTVPFGYQYPGDEVILLITDFAGDLRGFSGSPAVYWDSAVGVPKVIGIFVGEADTLGAAGRMLIIRRIPREIAARGAEG